MEKHAVSIPLVSYTVNKDLVQNVMSFIRERLPKVLSFELSTLEVDKKTAITIVYPDEALMYSINEYPNLPFNDKIETLKIELTHINKQVNSGIVLFIYFSKEKKNNHLHLSLMDIAATTKLPGIKQELLSILDHYKNNNSKIYKSEMVV